MNINARNGGTMTTSVREATTEQQLHIESVLSLDDPVGMVTDRDVVLRVVADGRDLGSTSFDPRRKTATDSESRHGLRIRTYGGRSNR
jgi:CBS domain-containing protein